MRWKKNGSRKRRKKAKRLWKSRTREGKSTLFRLNKYIARYGSSTELNLFIYSPNKTVAVDRSIMLGIGEHRLHLRPEEKNHRPLRKQLEDHGGELLRDTWCDSRHST